MGCKCDLKVMVRPVMLVCLAVWVEVFCQVIDIGDEMWLSKLMKACVTGTSA